VLDPIPEDDDEDTPEDDDVQAPTADSDLFYELTEQLYCDIWANQSRDEYAERLARRDEDYDSTPSSENVSTRTDVDNFHLSDVSPQSLSILTDSLSHLPPTASAIIADVVEGLVCLRIQLSFASTAPQIIAALSCFLRRFTTGSVSLSLLQQVPDLGTKLADVLTDVQPQSGSADSVLGALDFISRSVTTLESHPIVTKVRYLAFCALSYKLLAPFGLTLESESFQSLVVAHRNRPVRATDFIVSLTDSAYWLISTGWQVLQTGIVSTFYHSSASYTQIYERGVALDLRLNAIKGQTFEEGDVTRLIADLEAHVSELEECKVLAERTGIREAHALRANWREWSLKLQNLILLEASKTKRVQPFGIHLFGPAGHGKSNLTTEIFKTIGASMGWPIESKFMYTRSFEKHWNLFSTGQWCILLDDAGSIEPSSGEEDVILSSIIQICNNAPTSLEQAAIEDKGKTPCRAQLVMVTSNTHHMNVEAKYTAPHAVHRRLHYKVEVHVKDEYCTNGMCDTSKIPVRTSGYDNIYNLRVMRSVPDHHSMKANASKLEVVFENVTCDELMRFLVDEARKHYKNQSDLINAANDTTRFDVCECGEVRALCACPPPADHSSTLSPLCDSEPQNAALAITQAMSWLSMLIFMLNTIPNILVKWGAIGIVSRCFSAFARLKTCIPTGDDVMRFFGADTKPLSLRQSFERAGRKIRHSYYTPPTLVALAAVAAGGLILSRVRSQFTQQSAGTVPKSRKKEKMNPYETFDTKDAILELSEASRGSKGCYDTKVELVGSACVYIEFDTETETKIFRALGIKGNYYIAPNHCLPIIEGSLRCRLVREDPKRHVNTNVTFSISESRLVRSKKHELVMFPIDCLPPRTDIMKYFPTSMTTSVVGTYLLREDNGSLTQLKSNGSHYFRQYLNNAVFGETYDLYKSELPVPTFAGLCGAPLMAKTPQGPVIVGLHIAGKEHVAVSVVVTQPVLVNMMKQFCAPAIVPGVPHLSRTEEDPLSRLEPLHPRSTINFVTGNAKVIGTLKDPMIHPRSMVVPSVACELLTAQYGFKLEHGAPVMSGKRRWEPLHAGLRDQVSPKPAFDDKDMQLIEDAMVRDFTRNLTPEDWECVHIMPLDVAINGADGVAYVDKMPRDTSMGYPFNKKKREFMIPIPDEDGNETNRMTFTPEVLRKIEENLQNCRNGVRCHPVFNSALKDEPRTFEKIAAGNTRVFSGSPAPWGVVVRQHFLWLVRLVQNNNLKFESAPGIRAQSKSWGDLYRYLTEFGSSCMVAGDYKKFDKNMAPEVIALVYRVIIRIAKMSGNMDEEDITAMYTIAADSCFPLTNYFGDLIEIFGSNPSGHPLTVIVNGLVNSFYMRYAWLKLNPKHTVDDFQQGVRLMTYGDDNVAGVNPEMPWYNHTAISQVLASCGVVYTMADKEAESVPYIPMDEVSFLKRSWVYSEDLGDFAAPLEEKSIERSLMINVRSRVIAPESQFIACCASAVREYFFYGREVFEEKSVMLKHVINQLGFTGLIEKSTFPTYDSLVVQWTENSQE
jgi:hypothetical protein